MAFSYTRNPLSTLGGLKIVTGSYENDSGSTGGDIYTGLTNIYAISLQPKGAAIVADCPVVNETFPTSNDGITIVTTADESGFWIAFGE